jgi:putative FmdB family regulatory protein
MPMYEFACTDCGHPFEKRLRMSQARDPQECPSCGSGQTRRRIGSAIAVGGGASAPVSAAPPARSPFS